MCQACLSTEETIENHSTQADTDKLSADEVPSYLSILGKTLNPLAQQKMLFTNMLAKCEINSDHWLVH